MAEVPKIALRRLQVARADEHPDPDVINAFAENSLKTRERERVLAHLSQCGDCREIAALSLPEMDAATAIVSAKPETSWMRWPALRWAAVAACAVIVGTAVTLRYQTRTGQHAGEKSDAAISSSLDQKVQPAAPAAVPMNQSPPAAAQNAPVEARNAVRLADKSGPSKKVVSPSAREAETMAAAPVAAAPLERKSQSAFTSSNKTLDIADSQPQVVPGRAKDALQQPPAGAIGGVVTGGMMAKQKTAMAPVISGGFPSILVPRWTLSSDGTLQRSIDSGRSWQTIPSPGQGNFRALAASGADIWVGGAKGALYHSSDAGMHWTQVLPVAGTQALSADITGIEFTDLQHGSVSTAEGETWITADAGQTWSKK